MAIMIFHLYDYASGSCLIHQEMTPEEAELRNGQLQAKGIQHHWVLCEDFESTGCCLAQSGRLETVR